MVEFYSRPEQAPDLAATMAEFLNGIRAPDYRLEPRAALARRR